MTSLMRMMIVLALIGGAATPAVAQSAHTVEVSFAAPVEETPEYVCVVTFENPCRAGEDCQARPLDEIRRRGFLVEPGEAEVGGRWTFNNAVRPPLDAPRAPDLALLWSDVGAWSWWWPRALEGAVAGLRQPPDAACQRDHAGCLPALDVPSDLAAPGGTLSGYITCGGNQRSTGSRRVAIVHLEYPGNQGSGVSHVKLHGLSTALTFSAAVDQDLFTLARVIGGHYVPTATAAVGTDKRFALKLEPRCSTFVAIVPPHTSLPDDDLRVAIDVRGVRISCVPEVTAGNSVRLRIPYEARSRAKRLTIVVEPAAIAAVVRAILVITPPQLMEVAEAVLAWLLPWRTTFEAQWTDPLPAASLRLAHRTALVSWRRPCMFPTSSQYVVARKQCPGITLVNTGAVCETLRADHESCHYACTAPPGTPGFALPSPVRFERRSAGVGDREYDWTDSLDYSGERLAAFVRSAEQRVELEFRDLESWRNVEGDELRLLRLRSGEGAIAEIELPLDRGRDRMSVTLAGVSCGDRVRVQVDGSYAYDDDSEVVEAGRLRLHSAWKYRRQNNYGVFVGGELLLPSSELEVSGGGQPGDRASQVGVLPMRNEVAGTIGLFWTSWLTRVDAFELEGAFHVTRTAYGVVRPPDAEAFNNIDTAWYYRAEMRANVLTAPRGSLRIGVGAGGGWGSAYFKEDTGLVGSSNVYLLLAVFVRTVLHFPVPVWIEFSAGVRLGEEHYRFTTDFAGDPLPVVIDDAGPYLGVRLRFGK